MNQKALKTLGWIATCTAMLMYVSYFPQIMNNLHGMKSGFLQPMVAAINCSLWVTYGFMQEKKDWPLMMANLPGVFFGAIAAITALQKAFLRERFFRQKIDEIYNNIVDFLKQQEEDKCGFQRECVETWRRK